MILREFAHSTPGYDWDMVEKRVLRTMKVEGSDELYVGIKSQKATPVPNPKAAVEQIKIQAKMQDLQLKQQQFTISMQEEVKLNNAKILELEAKAAMEMEQAGGVKEGHKIAAFEAAIGALKTHNDHIRGQIELLLKSMEQQNESADNGRVGNVAQSANNAGTASVGAAG
jgi:predicted  nucleic acid-binding Zn-ribbon protein